MFLINYVSRNYQRITIYLAFSSEFSGMHYVCCSSASLKISLLAVLVLSSSRDRQYDINYPVYRGSNTNTNNCMCFDKPYFYQIPDIVKSKNNGMERLVIYLYQDILTIKYIKMYIPNVDIQKDIPHLVFENGDTLKPLSHETINMIFNANPNKISIPPNVHLMLPTTVHDIPQQQQDMITQENLIPKYNPYKWTAPNKQVKPRRSVLDDLLVKNKERETSYESDNVDTYASTGKKTIYESLSFNMPFGITKQLKNIPILRNFNNFVNTNDHTSVNSNSGMGENQYPYNLQDQVLSNIFNLQRINHYIPESKPQPNPTRREKEKSTDFRNKKIFSPSADLSINKSPSSIMLPKSLEFKNSDWNLANRGLKTESDLGLSTEKDDDVDDYDYGDFRIIGGNAATGSGTPLNIKGRSVYID